MTTVAGLSDLVAILTYILAALAVLETYLPLALRHVYRQAAGWPAVKTLALLVAYAKLLTFVVEVATLTILWRN